MLDALCILIASFCWNGDRPPPVGPPALTVATVEAAEMDAAPLPTPAVKPAQLFDPQCERQPPAELKPHYWAAARRYPGGATDCELARQGWQESRFRADAVSPVGAIGVAQFLPATAAELEVDPWDAEASIFAQARYVRWTRERWTAGLGGRTDYDIRALGLATYNFGLGNMRRDQDRNGWVLYRDAAPGLPAETRHYVHVIEGDN